MSQTLGHRSLMIRAAANRSSQQRRVPSRWFLASVLIILFSSSHKDRLHDSVPHQSFTFAELQVLSCLITTTADGIASNITYVARFRSHTLNLTTEIVCHRTRHLGANHGKCINLQTRYALDLTGRRSFHSVSSILRRATPCWLS